MKRKRPKGGGSKQAVKALRTAAEEEYAENTDAAGATSFFLIGVAAVCARNQIAFREATPGLVRALLAADPVKWPKAVRLSPAALWAANNTADWPIGSSHATIFARQWADLALEVGHRLDMEQAKAAVKRGTWT